ncbi:hypothetical protein WCE39_08165 [Luteimonas sp. MJ174]|uniref:hypothetical protein n=1 Tax=Luteimonas sp. MJ174 TaxID=3129237 RepID=UPI0031BBA0AE
MRELIEGLRVLEQDHEPDGWPAVRMRDITALLDALEAAHADIDGMRETIMAEHDARIEAAAALEASNRAVSIATGERNRVQAKWDKCRAELEAAREDLTVANLAADRFCAIATAAIDQARGKGGGQ